jgi:hypothetical protein
MLWHPGVGGDVHVTSNTEIVGTSAPGTNVPDGASVNTYGTVTELISAANNVMDSWGIWVFPSINTNPSAIVGEACLDILVGGATDDVLISGLLIGGAYSTAARAFFFPLHIPAGVRIAAQISAGAAQTTEASVVVNLYGGGVPPFRVGRKVTTYGTKINNSRGQAVTPTASGGTASVTEMTASTSEDHFYFLPSFQVSTDTTISTATYNNIGIGVGASTEERIGTWWFAKSADERQSGPFPQLGVFHNVPAGSRLTMLASNGATNDAAHDGLIHAVS